VPGWVASALSEAYRTKGIQELYSHQAATAELVHDGKNVVVVTPTASGKTLCYNLPVLHAVLENPDTRTLYLFPTKALAHDQLAELQDLGKRIDDRFGVCRSSTAIRCQQLTPGNKPKCLSTVGFTSPPFAFLRSFTSTQGQEDAACQKHRRDKCCEIQIDRRCQSASRMRLPRVEPQLPSAVNLWPKGRRAATPYARWRHPSASPVGYGANRGNSGI
jgi:Rad3-related DNA helicase